MAKIGVYEVKNILHEKTNPFGQAGSQMPSSPQILDLKLIKEYLFQYNAVISRAVGSVRQGRQMHTPPPKFWTGSYLKSIFQYKELISRAAAIIK